MLLWAPPPKLTLSQWADRYRILSNESSPEPGEWRTSRAEYLREIMDACTDPTVELVVAMLASQTGKTEVGNNFCGYHIDYDPAPMMVVQPTVEMAEAWSVDRLAPMLRDCPNLKSKVSGAKGRDSSNSKLHKAFTGGQLDIIGANAPAGLASRPKRIIFGDEIDRWPPSAGTEGDPWDLAWVRTTNFWNRKGLITSTPTVKGFSRVDTSFQETDKRFFHVPCPSCGEFHVLRWENVWWPKDEPEQAEFVCPCCREHYTNSQKNAAVRKGKWIATAPFQRKAGFHLSTLYSPWKPVGELAVEFKAAAGHPGKLQVFINTRLAELWEGAGKTVDPASLEARCEPYEAEVPGRVLLLTCGMDTQEDRIEAEVVGWRGGEESWSIEHRVFLGDPEIPEGETGSPWNQVTDFLRNSWRHEVMGEMQLTITGIDSGGSRTQHVYEYVKRHRADRIYAFKGKGGEGIPIVSAPSPKRMGKVKRPVKVFTIGVDQAKDIIYKRLEIDAPGAGYCHFPKGRDASWFKQLTIERREIEVDRRGIRRRVWKCPAGKRNEALDCRVYAFAALTMHAPQMDKLALRMKQKAEALKRFESAHTVAELAPPEPAQTEPTPVQATPTPPAPAPSARNAQDNQPVAPHNTRVQRERTTPPRRGNFATSWRAF